MRADKSCPCCAHFNMYSNECCARRSITSNDSCCNFKLREQKYKILGRRIDICCNTCSNNHNGINRFCVAGLDRHEDNICPTYTTKKEEVKMEDKKYYVFNPKSGATPKKVHTTINTAVSEAERIAEIQQDTEILVVQVIVGITRPSKQFIYRNYKLP